MFFTAPHYYGPALIHAHFPGQAEEHSCVRASAATRTAPITTTAGDTLRPVSRPSLTKAHVLVDMTPLEAGGQNGGAGLVARSLVRHMSALAPELQLTLLTSPASHHELAALDAPNVRRQCVVGRAPPASFARGLVDTLLPTSVRVSLKTTYHSLTTSRRNASLTQQMEPDLLFCPFTVTSFWRPGVRCVSVLYDLQHLAYPQFFSPEQRLNRQRHVADACARSQRVVCISDYVRGTLVHSLASCAQRAVTIPLGLLQDVESPDSGVLARLGLQPGAYLLFPANFWPHKNHRRLFDALNLAHTSLKLVCTGAPNALMHQFQSNAPANVVFGGYVSQAELTALLDASAGLIFASLYEGFGMPVLEAMARGKPVLCSNVTSLPEVAGDAAIFFDPTDAAQIAAAIDQLFDEPATVADLIQRGYRRAAALGGAREMALRYLGLFDQVLASVAA
jgi:glycosyltransferase involved in cell wall biosynthesis